MDQQGAWDAITAARNNANSLEQRIAMLEAQIDTMHALIHMIAKAARVKPRGEG